MSSSPSLGILGKNKLPLSDSLFDITRNYAVQCGAVVAGRLVMKVSLFTTEKLRRQDRRKMGRASIASNRPRNMTPVT